MQCRRADNGRVVTGLRPDECASCVLDATLHGVEACE